MPQYFPLRSNAAVRLGLYCALPVAAGVGWAAMSISHSELLTGVERNITQPVPFPHDVHAGQLRLDCRYCHQTVERSAFAGLPTSDVCLDCHERVWTGLPELEPVRASYETRIPASWRRVHDLPDFARFDHSIHVAKGIGCVSCHGRVDRMSQTRQAESLRMAWCLECHRRPEEHVRPREFVFDLAWEPPRDAESLRSLSEELRLEPAVTSVQELRGALVSRYGIRERTSCSICHQ
jgi:hypothetical protein